MNYYKATIQYDGTGYFGFQWQKGIPTVQNDVNIALAKLISGKVTTMSASRTDTGVHAMEQVVKITTEAPIDHLNFVSLFNQALPSQIRCLEIVPCEGKFRPANDHHTKVYHYYFTNKKIVPLEDKRFVSNISKELNWEAMQFCINAIIGTNDFKNFCSAGSNVKSTIRNISICELTEVNPHHVLSQTDFFKIPSELTQCYRLKVEGNGFLKQMIRHIVSGLWMVGSGKLTTDDFMKLLHGEKRDKRIWKVAPPNGLFLIDIRY
jgi:tRNA pseudouridine38-40 synthase